MQFGRVALFDSSDSWPVGLKLSCPSEGTGKHLDSESCHARIYQIRISEQSSEICLSEKLPCGLLSHWIPTASHLTKHHQKKVWVFCMK